MIPSSTVPYPSHRHLRPLDGIRGLAILMVMVSHLFRANTESAGRAARWAGQAIYSGRFGVDLFFVLSGFLITGILVDSLDDRHFFANFYARRALRIFPLYYGVLATLLLLTPALHLEWHGMGWLMAFYLHTMRPAQIANFSPGAGLSLNHFWSLAVEEQFYLVWPAAVFLVRARRKLFALTLAVAAAALLLRLALVAAAVSPVAIYVGTATRADALLLGGTLALLYRSRHWPRVLGWAPAGALASLALLAATIAMLPVEGGPSVPPLVTRLWLDGLRYTVLALGSGCLLAWSLQPRSLCSRVFSAGWLRFFGRYSYGLYVLHMLALPAGLAFFRPALLGLTHSRLIAVAGAGTIVFALSVLAACLSFHLYEKPLLRLKHRFDYRPQRIHLVPVRAGAPIPEQVLVADVLVADMVQPDSAAADPSEIDLVESKSFTSRVLTR